MFAIETFVEAITARQLDRAVSIASVMTKPVKSVAREIWNRWVQQPVPF